MIGSCECSHGQESPLTQIIERKMNISLRSTLLVGPLFVFERESERKRKGERGREGEGREKEERGEGAMRTRIKLSGVIQASRPGEFWLHARWTW